MDKRGSTSSVYKKLQISAEEENHIAKVRRGEETGDWRSITHDTISGAKAGIVGTYKFEELYVNGRPVYWARCAEKRCQSDIVSNFYMTKK
jgi:hypothetical protein